jgi:hypothetical protein
MAHKIYRFKLSEEIMEKITAFSKSHQNDERKMYKQAWNSWFEENKNEMEQEINRITRIGYKGDIVDKMFKAGRYYFRKKNANVVDKNANEEEEEETNTQKEKDEENDEEAEEEQVEEEEDAAKDATKDATKDAAKDATKDAAKDAAKDAVKDAKVIKKRGYIIMDPATLVLMDNHIKTALTNDNNFTPAKGYNHFCENNINILQTEIRRMFIEDKISAPEIITKIKKTYKNRCFILTRNYL